MPRSGQIIPKYIHPHDEVYINDNTEYNDYTADADGLTWFCCFASPKGRDKLMLFNNFTAFNREYGEPNFRLYGQPMYMPYVLLYGGLSRAWCLRITAKDATYANIILVVGWKKEDGKLKLKFKTYTRTNLRKKSDLDVFAQSLETTTPDDDGYEYFPIMYFVCQGKGVYGTDYRIRITHDKSADKDNDYKNYNVEVLSTEDGASTVETFNTTFYIDGTDPQTGVTNYMPEVINDVKATANDWKHNGSHTIECEFYYDNYLRLFDKYKEVYENNGYVPPTVETVDRLPAITLPSTTEIYHLTAADGSKPAGSMYVYDGDSGMFVASSYVATSVAALPAVATASTTTIYTLTATDPGDATKLAGSSWVTTDNATWTAAPMINDVEYLPSTTMFTAGTVYKLSVDRGTKAAGSEWIYDATASDFVAYVDAGPTTPDPIDYDISTWDMFGYNRFTLDDDEFIEIDGGKESISIMDLEGIPLASGSDGSMAEDQPAAVREDAMRDAYIEAFQGGKERLLLAKRRTPFDVVYDACFPVQVKKAMASLCLQRADHLLYLDFGLLSTTADVLDMATALGSLDSYMISKNTGMMKTLDPNTGKAIPVSITLWMAQQFPIHVNNYGNYTPFAGEDYATLSGYSDESTVKPIYDEELDADILEELYDNRKVNYLQALDEDTFIRGTQITCQRKRSDLSKENNVLVTLEIKRKIERMINSNRYHWTEEADLRLFKEDCEQIFSTYIGTKCRELTIDVKQSAWEKIRYITHVYLAVIFRTYQERGIVEIDINPRA